MTSFNKTSYDSGIKFEDLEKALQTLVFWGLGTLINPIQQNSIFCLTKRAAAFFLLQR
jgi:hypothetical protein